MNIIQVGSSGHYEYALAAAKRAGFRFTGICMGDRREKNTTRERFRKFGFEVPLYEDYSEMLEKAPSDIVIINSFMGYNAEFAAEALHRGKHVFIEKPIATTLDGLRLVMREYHNANTKEMLEKCGRKRVCLCGMFGILDEPQFMTARKTAASGVLGEIRLVNAQKSYKLGEREEFYSERELYGGTIPWVAIHAIDWAWRLFGLHFTEVTARQSRAANGGNGTMESDAICLFRGSRDEIVSVSADYFRPAGAPTHGDDRIRAVGERGIMEVRAGKVYITDENGEREASEYEKSGSIFDEFINETETGNPGRVSAMGSFYSTYLALCARESADKGKTVALDFDAFCREI